MGSDGMRGPGGHGASVSGCSVRFRSVLQDRRAADQTADIVGANADGARSRAFPRLGTGRSGRPSPDPSGTIIPHPGPGNQEGGAPDPFRNPKKARAGCIAVPGSEERSRAQNRSLPPGTSSAAAAGHKPLVSVLTSRCLSCIMKGSEKCQNGQAPCLGPGRFRVLS